MKFHRYTDLRIRDHLYDLVYVLPCFVTSDKNHHRGFYVFVQVVAQRTGEESVIVLL